MEFKTHSKSRRFATRLWCENLEERLTPANFAIADGDVAALVAAINTANTNNQPDTIDLAPGGNYTFTARADDSTGGAALPAITLDGGNEGNTLTINGNGATVQRSTVAGTPGFRFLKIGPTDPTGTVNAVDVTVDNLTVTGFDASVPTDAATPSGGAIFVNGANLTLSNCVLSSDAAAAAGAISMIGDLDQTLTMTDCTVTNNVGGSAVVQVQGPSLSVTGSSISDNGAGTGGIFFRLGTTCTINSTVIQNNGGTGIDAAGQILLQQDSVADNALTGVAAQGSLTLIGSTVNGNGTAGTAATGGLSIVGDAAVASSLSMINSTVDGNFGTAIGGIGIDTGTNTTFQADVNSCTITGNQATGAGAVAGGFGNIPGSPGQIARIGDTIIAGNSTSAGAADLGGVFNSQGYDFIGDATGATNIGLTAGNQFGTTASPLDPMLGPLQNNGGPTLTRLPLAGSPVIDAGNPAFVPPPDTDQRGGPRITGSAIDIGAAEVPPPPVNLSVTISDGQTTTLAGGRTIYTVVVTNSGTISAPGATFTFVAPTDTTSFSWTSVAVGGATGNGSTGTGSIGDTLTLPMGGSVTYTVTIALAVTATGSLDAAVQIAPPLGVTDSDTSDNTAKDTNTILPHVPLIAVGAGAGSAPMVHLYDAGTGQLTQSIMAYGAGFLGGVRVATGDFNGDGVDDVVTAAGPGGGPHIRLFDGKTGAMIREFFAYGAGFSGGVFVATGDVNGDGTPDIVTGAGAGGGPHVRVFDGKTGAMIREFFAFDASFSGGVNVAVGDVDDDGKADIITGAGPGGGPHVKVFAGSDNSVIRSFFAYGAGFTGGVNVAAGDVNGDGAAEIITGAGPGGGPHVRVFDGTTGAIVTEFFAFEATFTGGVRVAAVDGNGDGLADVVTGPGPGGGPRVHTIHPADQSTLHDFYAFSPADLNGVFVG